MNYLQQKAIGRIRELLGQARMATYPHNWPFKDDKNLPPKSAIYLKVEEHQQQIAHLISESEQWLEAISNEQK